MQIPWILVGRVQGGYFGAIRRRTQKQTLKPARYDADPRRFRYDGRITINIVTDTLMGLFRLLFILGIAYLAYRLFVSWQRLSQQPKPETRKQVKNVVPCHYCQLHIPETEAIQKNGRYYCSVQHLQQDQDN